MLLTKLILAATLHAAPAAQPLVPPRLWPSLPRASQAVPGVPPARVHELTLKAAEQVLGRAVKRGASALDIFTDPGFQTDRLFYLSGDTAQKVFAKYDLHVLTMAAGNAKDGKPFHLQAVLMGAGKIVMLYDRSSFSFKNPDFKGHTFRSEGTVTQTIEGPGALKVEGLSVDMMLHPKIRRFVKIDAKTVRVETSMGAQQKDVAPVSKR